jgi:serine/threonine-protein kinase
VVVCQAGPGNFYYRGVRLSDGASIELDGAVRSSGGFDVTNPADGTRYPVLAGVDLHRPEHRVARIVSRASHRGRLSRYVTRNGD